MKLNAQLEIVNNSAVKSGVKGKNKTYLSTFSLAKDQKSNQYFLIVNNTKKPVADKFKLEKNVEQIFCRFVSEGRATIALKEPNFHLIIQKADVAQLKSFLKLVHLASSSSSLNDETILKAKQAVDLDKENKQVKKPVTSISIRSRKEYLSSFKAIISQNMVIKSKLTNNESTVLNLLRLTITDSEIKYINKSLFQLKTLEYLDLSNNNIFALEDFELEKLQELIMANNQIKYIGKNIKLPNLIKLDLSNNLLTGLNHLFGQSFKKLVTLNLKSNKLKYLYPNFGYNLLCLKYFDASMNQLDSLPYSVSYLRLEMLDLQGNPFDFLQNLNKPNKVKFPTLVEIAARQVVNKRIKFLPREIPRTLYDYTQISNRCLCGQICYEYSFNLLTMYQMGQFSKSYSCFSIKGFDNQIPCLLTLCSLRCFLKNSKMQKVLNDLATTPTS